MLMFSSAAPHRRWSAALIGARIVWFALICLAGSVRVVHAQSYPLSGSPVALPGTIQAEDFDTGGPGVSFYDTTGGNSGGAYRPTDVDIEPSSTGGFDVGWTAAGEWLTYGPW